MAIDTATPRSRRAILGAALGGAAAIVAQAIGRPVSVRAADNDAVLVGAAHQGTTVTSIENTTAAQTSLKGIHAGTGVGVEGSAQTGIGLRGASLNSTATTDFLVPSHKTGVIGLAGDQTEASDNTDETGIYGYADLSSNSLGVWGDSMQGTGVYGTGDTGVTGQGGVGVLAVGSGAGAVGALGVGRVGIMGQAGIAETGVYGFAGSSPTPPLPPAGVGVYASAGSTSQTALQVNGKIKLNRSGRVSIGSTSTSRKITMGGVTTSSYILATLQTSVSGLYVRAVVPASGSFTIYLSKAPGKTVYVGYLVVN
jgi:hypothetical protein